MIDSDFIKIKNQAEYLNSLIESAIDNYNREGFENHKIYSKLENFQGNLEGVINFIEYMSKKPIVGHLQLMDTGKYECPEAGVHFSCGSRMEVLIKTEYDEEPMWNMGRVEYQTDGGYYFFNYNGDNVFLHEGMQVRVRK